MYDRLRHLTFEVMARLILGVEGRLDLERLGRLNDELAKGTTALCRIDVPGTTYARGLRARAALRDYLRDVIRIRRERPGDDALGLLMAAEDEDGSHLDDDELLEQAVILMFAGHETTTSLLTSFLLALRDHPDWHRRLATEQHAVVGDDALALDHLGAMPELDRVLKEVERLWPPISLCQRGVVAPVTFGEWEIPAGTSIIYSPWATHRLPEVFPDPDRFDPDRFAPPREEHRRTAYALVGFGGGPRLCIGQAFALLEAKVIASVLLRHYEWHVAPGNPRLRHVPTLHPGTGLPGRVRSVQQ